MQRWHVTICPYNLFVHFLVIPVTTAACMFAPPINLLIFLSSRPLTTIRHTKYGKQRQKYEYRHCRCGCSFYINVCYSVDGQTCHVNLGTIPDDHFDVDENPDNKDKDKEVRKLIDALIIEHCFAKNYGPHHIISELCRQNIPDCKIPAQKQLENRLYYFQKHKFGYHNEIGPL